MCNEETSSPITNKCLSIFAPLQTECTHLQRREYALQFEPKVYHPNRILQTCPSIHLNYSNRYRNGPAETYTAWRRDALRLVQDEISDPCANSVVRLCPKVKHDLAMAETQ